MIQFSVGDDVDDGDIVYVDNFKIAYSTAAGSTQTMNYTENSAVGMLRRRSPTPHNGAVIHSASVTVTNHHANDLLSVTGCLPGGIMPRATMRSTGVLTLTGTASLADYQTALSHIIFSNTSDNPDRLDRALTVTVNDGLADSNLATTTIHVTAIDDCPRDGRRQCHHQFRQPELRSRFRDWALLANDTDPTIRCPASPSVTRGYSSGSASTMRGSAVSFTDCGSTWTVGGSFDYTASDGTLSATAQVTITDGYRRPA